MDVFSDGWTIYAFSLCDVKVHAICIIMVSNNDLKIKWTMTLNYSETASSSSKIRITHQRSN